MANLLGIAAYGSDSEDEEQPKLAVPEVPSRPASGLLVDYGAEEEEDSTETNNANISQTQTSVVVIKTHIPAKVITPTISPVDPKITKRAQKDGLSSLGVVKRSDKSQTSSVSPDPPAIVSRPPSSLRHVTSQSDWIERTPPPSSSSSSDLCINVISAIDEIQLPPEPSEKVSEAALRLMPLYSRKLEGKSVIEYLQNLKSFRNPNIYSILVDLYGLDESGSNYPVEMYDPKAIPKDAYYEALGEQQKKRSEQKDKERLLKPRTEINFVSSASTSSSASASSIAAAAIAAANAVAQKARNPLVLPMPGKSHGNNNNNNNLIEAESKKRSSKWDQALPAKKSKA